LNYPNQLWGKLTSSIKPKSVSGAIMQIYAQSGKLFCYAKTASERAACHYSFSLFLRTTSIQTYLEKTQIVRRGRDLHVPWGYAIAIKPSFLTSVSRIAPLREKQLYCQTEPGRSIVFKP
jgi:hypothetical protein